MRRLLWLGLLLSTYLLSAQPADTSSIVFCLYTVEHQTLKLSAQLRPFAVIDPSDLLVVLEIWRGESWVEVGQEKAFVPGYDAHFRVPGWEDHRSWKYRIRHGADQYEGVIQQNPKEKNEIVVAAFTGNSPWPGGGDLSKDDLVAAVLALEPDLLVFTGDQVYPHQEHTKHWVRFGEEFGPLTRNLPTVVLPDDHDVGHPNLWGAGGKKAFDKDWEGGYLKSADYVNMVQRQQTWHMPDPIDPTPIGQEISVYYTRLRVGGIDFAVIEDRKWKTGCLGVAPEGIGPRPDHIDQPNYDPASFDHPQYDLLGERQERFLADWGQDWTQAEMKCVLSQTLFAMVANYHSRDKTFYYADFDANGWPQTPRNRAVDLLRQCFAFHICGDQHLSSIVQYGKDEFRDGSWAFCVPSIANYWPRWWEPKLEGLNPEPGAQPYTGDFLEGFGNRITVFAHTNPPDRKLEVRSLEDGNPGFGLVRFNKAERSITMENWPRMVDPNDPDARQYEGWPRTIGQLDNYGRNPVAWLPTLQLGQADQVVRVFDAEGQLVYALRTKGTSFQPWTFAEGTFSIVIGEGHQIRTLEGVQTHRSKAQAGILRVE